MRKCVLQMLFIVAAFLVFPGCSDDEDNVDWEKVVKWRWQPLPKCILNVRPISGIQ